jgi:antitoxin (DNA-binding transcriptional repressor) of toxin-antitoxin stability system
VDRVREARATYVIERAGKPVARISPVERATFTMGELRRLWEETAAAEPAYTERVAEALARHARPRRRRNPWAR